MSMLFISYSTKDRPTAEIFYDKLIENSMSARSASNEASNSTVTKAFNPSFDHGPHAAAA
jgi:hypothetical protein